MIKTAHELDLMRVASQATLKCYEAVFKALKAGMTQNDVSSLIGAGYARLGFPGFASIQVGEYNPRCRTDRSRRRRSAKARSS